MAKTAALTAGANPLTAGSRRKRKLIVLGAPVLIVLLLAGAWFGGLAPRALSGRKEAGKETKEAEAKPPPVFLELPEMITNLNGNPRRPSYVKLRARVELARTEDLAIAQGAMPRLQDLFQTYLREVRPEELRGSAGTYRLREELLARGNLAVAPARITDVLFTEMLVQ
jgi:flagellar FliL protein